MRRGRTRVRVPRESCGGFATASLTHSISFPKKLNVEYKVSFRVRIAVLARRRPTGPAQALMIGALLLLDYMFFEDEGACQFQPWRCVCKFKCCDCYCLGFIFPCSCNCPAKEPEEGAGAPFAVDVVELIEAPAAEVIARAQ